MTCEVAIVTLKTRFLEETWFFISLAMMPASAASRRLYMATLLGRLLPQSLTEVKYQLATT
jgi:hypothetical protein